MSFLTRYQATDPFLTLRQEMNDFMRNFWSQPFFARSPEPTGFFAPIDVREKNGQYLVKMDIPGIAEKDIKITCMNESLSVSGERKEEKTEQKGDVRYQECQYGAFSRTVPLPGAVDTDKVHATYKDGVLEITLPKAKGAEGKDIKVEPAK
jgi:HSP20 family protein